MLHAGGDSTPQIHPMQRHEVITKERIPGIAMPNKLFDQIVQLWTTIECCPGTTHEVQQEFGLDQPSLCFATIHEYPQVVVDLAAWHMRQRPQIQQSPEFPKCSILIQYIDMFSPWHICCEFVGKLGWIIGKPDCRPLRDRTNLFQP